MLDCADVAIKHYSLNPAQWGMVKNMCEGLLNKKEHERYIFHHKKDRDNDRQAAWTHLLEEFDPQDRDIDSSDYKGEDQRSAEAEGGLRMHVTSISCFISCKPIRSTSRTIIILLRWRPIAGSW